MEVTIYEGLGRYDVIYREIGIHGKYAKKYYFYVICYTNVFVYVVKCGGREQTCVVIVQNCIAMSMICCST